MLQGSLPALVTPFTDGALDLATLKKLVEWHIAEGSNGLVPVGTTGESPTLTHAEHETVVAEVVKAAAGRIPVVAGAGSNNTTESIRLAKHAESVGADAVLVVTPFDTEDEVVTRANAGEYGLVAYVHSLDPRRIYRLSRALQFGMVAVNRTKVTGAPIPFGGTKQSGLGREGARRGMEEFMDIKYVCRDWA